MTVARPSEPDMKCWGSACVVLRPFGYSADFEMHGIDFQVVLVRIGELVELDLWGVPNGRRVAIEGPLRPEFPEHAIGGSGRLHRCPGHYMGPIDLGSFPYVAVLTKASASIVAEFWSEPPSAQMVDGWVAVFVKEQGRYLEG